MEGMARRVGLVGYFALERFTFRDIYDDMNL